jgi:hypothetical protein
MNGLERCRQPVLSGPADLIGLPYKLGADPVRHGATDCVNLCRAVLQFQGIDTPVPTRDWYRRLKRGDVSVFAEQLNSWGSPVMYASPGTIALSQARIGYGLAAFYDSGWIHCNAQTLRVAWSPAVNTVALYCPGKSN